jgi:hypothetical protein
MLHAERQYDDPRPSAARIAFERNRALVEHDRAETGLEPFICTPAEMQEIMADDPELCKGDKWLRMSEAVFLRSKLPRYWATYKHHINVNALNPEQQEWVLRIDPDQRQKMELSEVL